MAAIKNSDSTPAKNVLDVISGLGIAIRKGFSASTKDDAQPASVFWYKDFITQNHYTSVDLAVKYQGYEFALGPKSSLLLFPKVEWHKNGDTSNNNKSTKNTLTAGGNIEFDYQVSPGLTPYIIGTADYKKDYVKKNETLNLCGYLSLFCASSFLPGSMKVRDANGRIIFRYYIYTGYEYYKSVAKGSQATAFWASRFSAELNPLPPNLQFTFDYTYRVKVADQLYRQGDVYWFCTGLNYYFDTKKRIGIGIDYSKGYDPNSSFTNTDKIDIGLKLKI
jgi:hypothetical protein